MTSLERKTEVLLAVARAFMERGPWIQYDQRSMDRTVGVTPRHDWLCTPEFATEQHRLYMDCARFICTVYYAAFGVRLEADVTWNMLKAVKDRVFYYKLTRQETPQEQQAIWKALCDTLQPGDAIVYLSKGKGHIVLYTGDGVIYESAGGGSVNSYRYDERHDTVRASGLYIRTLQALFNEHLENPDMGVFSSAQLELAVLRPMNRVGEPTAQALLRVGEAKELFCQVLSSHPGGMSVPRGGNVSYTVCIRNDSSQSRQVTAVLTAPAGAVLRGESVRTLTLQPHGEVRLAYTLDIEPTCGPVLPAPEVTVNGLKLWAQRCLVEGNIPAGQLEACAKRLEALLPQTPDLMAAASEAYSGLALFRPTSEETLRYLYWRYDSVCGDVLWRDIQQPERDGCLYSYFGGTGVMTPELGADMTLRTQNVHEAALRPGDILLCSDDALFTKCYGCVVTEQGLLGRFAPEDGNKTLQGEALCRFIDSLPGRFCFTVFRPAMIWRK